MPWLWTLQHARHLRERDCACCRRVDMRDAGAQALAGALGGLKSLTSLSISGGTANASGVGVAGGAGRAWLANGRFLGVECGAAGERWRGKRGECVAWTTGAVEVRGGECRFYEESEGMMMRGSGVGRRQEEQKVIVFLRRAWRRVTLFEVEWRV